MRKYLRMKYEQFMMRLFDRLMLIFQSNERLSWYPEYVIGDKYTDKIIDLEDKIVNLERRNDALEWHLLSDDERIEELEEKLYYYEPFDEDEEEL